MEALRAVAPHARVSVSIFSVTPHVYRGLIHSPTVERKRMVGLR
jgi:hypothetical protein